MLNCRQICQSLKEQIGASFLPATVHSRFQSAANLSTPLGLVTLLGPGKSLQPYSILLEREMDLARIEDGTLRLYAQGLWCDDMQEVSFAQAEVIDLMYRRVGPLLPESGRRIRSFLLKHGDYELVQLLMGQANGVYAKEIEPRFQMLRQAVRIRQIQEMVCAAGLLAGCGMGLTPSSDDLLCGYLWALWSLDGMEDTIRRMAAAAAMRTNDISAALLTRAGEGRFSADILALTACLMRQAGRETDEGALCAVAEFGSTSGRDFLTGAYLGITDICYIRG